VADWRRLAERRRRGGGVVRVQSPLTEWDRNLKLGEDRNLDQSRDFQRKKIEHRRAVWSIYKIDVF
jgi:hypothetical protein